MLGLLPFPNSPKNSIYLISTFHCLCFKLGNNLVSSLSNICNGSFSYYNYTKSTIRSLSTFLSYYQMSDLVLYINKIDSVWYF